MRVNRGQSSRFVTSLLLSALTALASILAPASPTAIAAIAGIAALVSLTVPTTARGADRSETSLLTLEEVVSLAQARGLDARSAAAERDAARARDRAWHARLWPALRLGGTLPSLDQSINAVVQDSSTKFVRQREVLSSVQLTLTQPVPLVGGEFTISSGLTRLDLLGTRDSRVWQSEPLILGWRQELFQPRRLVWDGRERAATRALAESRYLESMESIALGASQAYFEVYAARVARDNALANATVNDTLYTLSRGRYEVGRIGENDLLQSELALLRARASVDGARLRHERALASLRIWIDAPPDVAIAIAPPPVPPEFAIDTTRVVNEALRHEGRMKQEALSSIQARRGVSEALAANRLNASLSATLGLDQTAERFEDAYRDPFDRQQLALRVDVPLWQWGAGGADVQAARADRAGQESRAERTRREVAEEALFAARGLVLARNQLNLAAKADTVGAKRFDVAKNRYVIGKIGIADLYLAQSEKDAALEAYVQAMRGYWLAYYELRRITLYDFERDRSVVTEGGE